MTSLSTAKAFMRRDEADLDTWCILRTSGRSTLRLAKSLTDDGFEVWTPVETRSIRKPRDTVRRKVVMPLMPSYIFARAKHLVDLLEIANQTVRPRRGHSPTHASFSVMHWNDSIPVIGDRQLDQVRKLEARRMPVAKASAFKLGVEVKVKMEGGSFAGMQGRVERSDHTSTIVCFSARMTVKIPTCLLSIDEVAGDEIAQRAPRHRNAGKYLGQVPNVGKALSQKCEACNEDTDREAASTASRS